MMLKVEEKHISFKSKVISHVKEEKYQDKKMKISKSHK